MASIDDREVRAFAADLRRAPQRVVDQVPGVIKKGAVEVKKQMVEEMGSSFWFKGAKPSISFDILDGGFTAEIGPVSGPGGMAGDLASLAYFGGSSGGGGTVPDPVGALNADAPRMEKALADVLGEAL
jgi:hypothetical protein